MIESFYATVKKWADSSWDLEAYRTITSNISKTLLEIGHGESAIGKAVLELQSFFDEMYNGYGLIMTDEEMQADLHKLLESGISIALQSIIIEVKDDTAIITNLNELKKSGDPEAKKRYDRKRSFDDFVQSTRK